MELLVTIGGKEYIIHDTITNIWFVMFVLIIFTIVVNKKLKQMDVNETPSGFMNVVEMGVESANNLILSVLGEKNMMFAPYMFTLLCFLALSNLLGLIGLTPPTSDYSVTFTLALVTFFITVIMGIKTSGIGGYLKGFTEPFVLFTPLNVIGELANPISLSFRLFGNIMSGGLIMTLVYHGLGYFAPIVTPLLHGYFDVFSGLLQTFIFVMLSMIFISGATEE